MGKFPKSNKARSDRAVGPKYPSKVIKKDSAKKTAKKSRVKAFVKLVNYQHLMPTRYTLDVDLKDAVSPDVLHSKDKNITALKETKKRFENASKPARTGGFSPSSGSEHSKSNFSPFLNLSSV
ncbi:Ribosomal protein L27e [Sesbania bispinosa]|nr:Ribosomal protein L27e [Sesbania bispinosa]